MAFPLIIRHPPLVRPGPRVDALVASFDVGLTVLDLAGAAYPARYAAHLPGSSLVPLLRGGAHGPRTAHYYRYFQHHAAVRWQKS
jgi:arylsulfatase A-like enzyme